MTGNPNARDWNENYKYFASHVFEIFVPRIADKDASYDIRVNANIKEIKYTTSEGEQTIDCDTTNNTRSLVVPDYIGGSYSIHNYTQGKDGETLDRPFWSGGNARILHQGGEGRLQPYVSFNGHTSALEGIKGGLQMVTLIQGDKISLTKEISHYMSNANHNPIKHYQLYYGVGKLTDEQILDTETDPNLLTWYSTLAEAKEHEKPSEGIYIYGIATDCTDNIWATGGPQIYQQIYFKVRTENTQPFERVFSKARAYIYRDEARTDMVTLNRSYVPSEYDINGDIMPGTHVPSGSSGGATFQLVPYTTNISAIPKNSLTDKGQTSFNIGNGNEVKWEITASLSGLTTNTDDIITIKHVIPNGEDYKDGSANIEPTSVKTLNDGSTEITWEFNGYSVTQGLPKIIFYSVIPLNTPDRTQFEHKTVIDTPGDRRSETEFRTDKDGITVIADASMMINKSVSKDTVEIGESFEYTLSYVNNSEKDYTNGVFLDILPFNGDDRGTSYNGSYTIEKFKIPTGVTIEGTNTPASDITDDPLNNGVTNWAPLNNGDEVTAIRFKVADVAKRTSNEVKLTIKPTGNLGDDIYINNFKSSLSELDLPLVSNTVQTKVMSREIRGTVWHDDNNGLIDVNEEKLEDITVCLLDETGNEISRTVTDTNGNYIFENLLPGTYSVKFITDAGGVKPTIVPTSITDKSNHVNNQELTSDSFILTSSDTEKVLNLGLISSLKISKSSDVSLVDIGDTVTYSIKVTNTNTLLDASNVRIKDTVNDKLEIVENSISHNGTLNTNNNTINWTLSNLKAGQSVTLTFDIVVSRTSVGKITNVATVLGSTITDEETESNEATISIIEYSKKSSVNSTDILRPNQVYTYYIDVKNTSGKDVTDIKVVDVLPSGIDIVDGSISDNGNYNPLTRKVSWNLSINANTTKTVQFEVRTKTPSNKLDEIVNIATVNGKNTNEVLNKVGKPLIGIEKFVDKTTALENEEITYTIKVTNTGNVDSGNITLSDEIPVGSVLVNSPLGDGNLAGNTITWDLGTLAPNESKNISFKVTANELANGKTRDLIKNQATVNEPSSGDISSNKVQTEICKPLLEFNKTVNRNDLLTVGEELIYSINVRNVGTAPQTSYVIRDSIPAYTELVEIFDDGNLDNDTIVWEKQNLQPGESTTVRFKVRTIQNGDKLKWTLSNTATVNGVNTNTLTNEVAIPKLTFKKEVNKDVANEGDKLVYTITVENVGEFPAYNIEINDSVPKGTSSSDNTSITIDELKAGKSQSFSFKATVDELPDGILTSNITNTATVNGHDTNEVVTVINKPKLEIEKISNISEDTILKVGDEITYTIRVSNTGTDVARNIVVSDVIPNLTKVVDKGTASKRLFSDKLKWTIDELNPGDTQDFEFTVITLSKEDLDENELQWQVTNQATLEFENKTLESNEVINNVGVPIFELNKEVTEVEVYENDNFTYKLTVENIGSVNSETVTVTDVLPPGVELVEDSISDGGIYNPETNTITWTLPSINAGEIKNLTFSVKALEMGENVDGSSILESLVEGVFSIKHQDKITETKIDSNEVLTKVVKPVLTIEKLSNPESNSIVLSGDEITYTMVVTNEGTASTKEGDLIQVSDTIPQGTTIVDISDNGELNSDTNIITWTLGKIDKDESKTVSFKVKVNEGEDLDITNVATLAYNEKETKSNEVLHYLRHNKLLFNKFVDKEKIVSLEDELKYTIKVDNQGTIDEKELKVTDKVPRGTTLVSIDNGGVEKDGNITWSIPKLTVGENTEVSFTVKVNKENENGNIITNTAYVNDMATNTTENKIYIEPVIPQTPIDKIEEVLATLPKTGAVQAGLSAGVVLIVVGGAILIKRKRK